MGTALSSTPDETTTGWDTPYANVPAAAGDAELDPHWAELRGGSPLPPTYMPPSMPGPRAPWQRAVAIGLAAMFLGVTATGVCLTYGPPIPGL